jgi:predicted N-formylglutamate amidohydrolase
MDDLLNLDGDMESLLIGPGEAPAFDVVNADGAATLQLVCDHASQLVPAALTAF